MIAAFDIVGVMGMVVINSEPNPVGSWHDAKWYCGRPDRQRPYHAEG